MIEYLFLVRREVIQSSRIMYLIKLNVKLETRSVPNPVTGGGGAGVRRLLNIDWKLKGFNLMIIG